MSDAYDLIIIGGGPVGMSLSLALRNSGLSVLLLEARERLRPFSRAPLLSRKFSAFQVLVRTSFAVH